MTTLRLNEDSLSSTSVGEERTYLLDWNTPLFATSFSQWLFLVFSQLKLTLNEKRFQDIEHVQENVTDRWVWLRKRSSRNFFNSSCIAGLSVWLLKRTAFKLTHIFRKSITTLCTAKQKRKQSRRVFKLLSYKFVACGINVASNVKNILHLLMFITKNESVSTTVCDWIKYEIRKK
jgi:hypothetical protein